MDEGWAYEHLAVALKRIEHPYMTRYKTCWKVFKGIH